jgi:uncharacterized membrane protein
LSDQQPQELVPAVNINYVGIGQLTVFFVSEDELRLIETGSPAAACLNLGIAFSSIGIGSLTSLLLSDPSKSLYKFAVGVIITVVSIIAGIALLVIWSRLRKQASETISRIRSRAIASAGGQVMEAPVSDNLRKP